MSKPSRGEKRSHHEEEHEEHVNHEAWVIPYADMLTLLMALFLVMFAMSQVDSEKFDAVSESLRTNFGGPAQIVPIGEGFGTSPIAGGLGVLDGTPPMTTPTTVTTLPPPGAGDDDDTGDIGDNGDELGSSTTTVVVNGPPTNADVALAMQREAYSIAEQAYRDLAAVEAHVAAHAGAGGVGGAIGFRLESRGLVVSIVTDQVLFADGRADLQSVGVDVLDIVAAALVEVPNEVAIEGHTDSRPISTARFPSNWELSTARATSVLRYLVDRHGFDPERVSASGYADTRPIAGEDTADGKARNRRVEIVVLSNVSLDPLFSS